MRPSARLRPNWCSGYQALFEGLGLTRHHQHLGDNTRPSIHPLSEVTSAIWQPLRLARQDLLNARERPLLAFLRSYVLVCS